MKDTDYQYVLAITKCGSFRRAAEFLHISQPSLSRYISNLEQKLGVVLFDRSSSPVQVTSAGECFCFYANTILETEHKLLLKLQESISLSGRAVRIGFPLFSGEYFLSRLIPLLVSKQPNIRLDPVQDLSDNLARQLVSRQLEVTITTCPVSSSSVKSELMFEEKICLVGARNHPALEKYDTSHADLDHLLSIDLSQLTGVKFIHCKPIAKTSYLAEENLKSAGFQAAGEIKSSSLTLALDLALQQVGLTPVMFSQLKYGHPEIIKTLCPIDIGDCKLPFYLSYDKFARKSIPELDIFLSEVQEEYRVAPYM